MAIVMWVSTNPSIYLSSIFISIQIFIVNLFLANLSLKEMLYRVFFGEYRTPFPGLFPMAIPTQVKAGKRPDLDPRMPQSFVEIVVSCWDVNPENRPDCEHLIAKLQALEQGIYPLIPPYYYILGGYISILMRGKESITHFGIFFLLLVLIDNRYAQLEIEEGYGGGIEQSYQSLAKLPSPYFQ